MLTSVAPTGAQSSTVHRWDIQTIRGRRAGFFAAGSAEHHTAPGSRIPAPDLRSTGVMEKQKIASHTGGLYLALFTPGDSHTGSRGRTPAQGRSMFGGVAASGLREGLWAMFKCQTAPMRPAQRRDKRSARQHP